MRRRRDPWHRWPLPPSGRGQGLALQPKPLQLPGQVPDTRGETPGQRRDTSPHTWGSRPQGSRQTAELWLRTPAPPLGRGLESGLTCQRRYLWQNWLHVTSLFLSLSVWVIMSSTGAEHETDISTIQLTLEQKTRQIYPLYSSHWSRTLTIDLLLQRSNGQYQSYLQKFSILNCNRL